jgi:deoxyribonuclease-4
MRIGRHMPTHSKMVRAAEIAQQIGCETIQIFASNPTAWRTPTIDQADCQAFALVAASCHLTPVVLHAPYLINLGSPDAANWEKSINLLTWTLQKGAMLGASFVVFHTGSHRGMGVEAGIERVALGIKRVMQAAPETVMLLLENDVGAGHTLGHSFAQLAAILALQSEYQDRLGVCLDTAHLWGAGYDISSPASVLQVLQDFDRTIGLIRLKVLHLNDTEKALGSHRDVHARLGEGIINEEGLRGLLTDPRLAHAAVLLETPIATDNEGKEDWHKDALQIARAKALAGYVCE